MHSSRTDRCGAATVVISIAIAGSDAGSSLVQPWCRPGAGRAFKGLPATCRSITSFHGECKGPCVPGAPTGSLRLRVLLPTSSPLPIPEPHRSERSRQHQPTGYRCLRCGAHPDRHSTHPHRGQQRSPHRRLQRGLAATNSTISRAISAPWSSCRK